MLHVRRHLFHEFLFVYLSFLSDSDVIMTSVQCILFVALLIPFSYEDKRLAQHWTMHIDASIDQCYPQLKTRIGYVPKADILNT